MADAAVNTQRENSVGIITLNRPEKMNALSAQLLAELAAAVLAFEEDPEVKAIVLTGTGEKAFSAGMDIREMVQHPPEERRKWMAGVIEQHWHLATCTKPTIAAVNGLAYGGGAMLTTLCDFRVGCERTRFAFLGVTYGRINSTWTLPLIVGWGMAKDLLLTGRVVEAEEACRINLLNRLVPSADLIKAAVALGQTIAANNQEGVRIIKKLFIDNIGEPWHAMHDAEVEGINSIEAPLPRDSFKGFLDRKG